MSYYARKTYAASGTGPYSVPFSYIAKTHIEVYIDGEEITAFTWPSAGQILLDEDPGEATILIIRNTPKDDRLVDFQDGSILTEANLDKAYTQDFFIAQETLDIVASGPLAYHTDGYWDFKNTQVSLESGHGIPEPTSDGHIATKKYVNDTFQEDIIEGYKNLTYNYMLKAQQWATEDEDVVVENEKYSAKHWMYKAEDEKIAAAGSASAASDSASTASGHASTAATQAGIAETEADRAKSYADSLNLPQIQEGDAEKILEVNATEDGYELAAPVPRNLADLTEKDHSSLTDNEAEKHRLINDAGTSATELFSASKIISDLAGKSATGHTHVEADITDLDHDALKLQGRTLDSVAPSDGQVVTWDDGNSKWKPVTPSGGGSYSSKASAYRVNSLNLATGEWTKIPLTDELFDGLNEWDSTTNYRFVADAAGYYIATGHVGMTDLLDGDLLAAGIYKNGSGDVYHFIRIGSAGGVRMNFSKVLYLAANDFVELWGYQDSGATKPYIVGAAGTSFTIHRLS